MLSTGALDHSPWNARHQSRSGDLRCPFDPSPHKRQAVQSNCVFGGRDGIRRPWAVTFNSHLQHPVLPLCFQASALMTACKAKWGVQIQVVSTSNRMWFFADLCAPSHLPPAGGGPRLGAGADPQGGEGGGFGRGRCPSGEIQTSAIFSDLCGQSMMVLMLTILKSPSS